MPEVSVEAPVEHVTVYARGARVRRVTTIPAPLPTRVRIVGLPLGVIDDTVRVEVGGPALATAVRVGVDAPASGGALAEEPAELAEARRRLGHAEAVLARLDAGLATLVTAPVIETDPSDLPPAEVGAVLAARRALVAVHRDRELAVRAQLASARREAEDARRAFEAAADRDRRTSSARPAKLHELRKYVELEITATAASEIVVHVEYLVDAARWAPTYVARIEGDRVRFEIRAVVAQETGEDWTAVPLGLSTAEPARFAQLPELAAQKIGRRQLEPAKPGFRAPPTGAEALYADYDRTLRLAREIATDARSVPEESAPAAAPFAAEVWDEDSSRGKEAFSTPPAGSAALSELAVAMPLLQANAPKTRSRAPAGGAPDLARRLVEEPGPAVPRLDYGNLVMAAASAPRRGTLGPAAPDRHASAIASELAAVLARVTTLPLPAGCTADWTHAYDYAFVTEGAVDVAGDGAWHSIAVAAKLGTAKLAHVAVPREQPDVFRVASIASPFAAPLLPGPIDVYDRGQFLVTSEVAYTPPGAPVEVGLGVDPTVKIARNVEYREEAAGMLRGALRLHHAISIEIENLSARPIDLEVRERLPVVREGDDEVEVIPGKVEPPWERWTPDPSAPREQRLRGGYRWKLAMPASSKAALRAAYEIKIAGKLELVGGNRRES